MRQEMLPKANAKCKVCGNPYYVCTNCLKYRDKGIYGWKLVADSPQCYQMYVIMNAYMDGKATKEEVQEVFTGIERFVELPTFIAPYDAVYTEVTGKKEEPEVVAEEANKPVYEKKEQHVPYNTRKQKFGKK